MDANIEKAMENVRVQNPTTMTIKPKPIEFNPTGETVFATTKMLEKTIASFLQSVFSDLKYVGIGLNDGSNRALPNTVPYGEFFVNLYFSPNDSVQNYEPVFEKAIDENGNPVDKVVAKTPVLPYKSIYAVAGGTTTNKDTPSSKMLDDLYKISGQSRNRCRRYQVNNITKSALSQFMFENDPRRIDWKLHIMEIEDKSNIYSNNGNYFVGVIGLSLGKFVDAIYGSVDENNEPIDYRLSLVRNIVASYYGGSRNYIVAIHRMSRAAVKRLAEMANVYPGPQIQFGTMVR